MGGAFSHIPDSLDTVAELKVYIAQALTSVVASRRVNLPHKEYPKLFASHLLEEVLEDTNAPCSMPTWQQQQENQ